MFTAPQAKKSFVAIVWTYTLDLVGFSLVIPVLAPLLLDTDLGYFTPETSTAVRTTALGLLYASYGAVQFIALPIIGTAADRYGRRVIFLVTIANAVIGYLIMALGALGQSLTLLFVGRMWTGFATGNMGLAQSAAADLTTPEERPKAFSTLIGIGSFGFMAGPWIGGKLGDATWLHGSAAFFFGALVSAVNLAIVWALLRETWDGSKVRHHSFLAAYKSTGIAFAERAIRFPLLVWLAFSLGWALFLQFVPTYWVQRFDLSSGRIGDFIAYQAIVWALSALVLNRYAHRIFSIGQTAIIASFVAGTGMIAYVASPVLWSLLFVIPYTLIGGSLGWVNINTIVSQRTPADLQGRVMGVTTSVWALAQVISGLIAGPLAGWNLYLPLSLSAACLLAAGIALPFDSKEVG